MIAVTHPGKIGDFGLVLGIAALFFVFQTFDFSIIFSLVPTVLNENFIFFGINVDKITLISLLLFCIELTGTTEFFEFFITSGISISS